MTLACAIAYTCYRVKLGGVLPVGWPDLAFALLEIIFFITSRYTLAKYHARSQQLLKAPGGPRRARPPSRPRQPSSPDHGNPPTDL